MTLEEAPPSLAGRSFKFDVVLSFAGAQRDYVVRVARALQRRGLRVFYDLDHEGELAGAKLPQSFDSTYRLDARRCVIFLSAEYKQRPWTQYELDSALARRLEDDAYIILGRFDDTDLLGLPPSTGFVDLRKVSPEEFAVLIISNLATSDDGSLNGARVSSEKPAARWPLSLAAVTTGAATGLGVVASLQAIIGAFATTQVIALVAAAGISLIAALVVVISYALRARGRPKPYGLQSFSIWIVGSLVVGGLAGFGVSRWLEVPDTYSEIAYNRGGTPLFSDPGFHQVGDGMRIPFGTQVEVRCKVEDASGMDSVTAWYLIVAPQEYAGRYAPADTFLNGDDGPEGTTAVDPRVADC